MSVLFFIFLCFLPLPKGFPTTLVHLKYLYFEWVWFRHEYAVPFLVLLLRSSPNLEKLKIEVSNKNPCILLVLILSKLQVLSFMFTPNCRRCPLSLKLTGFVLNVSKSCTMCPLSLTQFIFFC
ncbi:hypothetical protein Hanom_Chr13g01243821 [Helianthus anomalus]